MFKIVEKYNDWQSKSQEGDYITQCNKDWCDKFPEIRLFKLGSDTTASSRKWEYSYNKKTDVCEIDMDLVIEKGESWTIEFEMSFTEKDSNIHEEKVYAKKNINWETLNNELKKVTGWIRKWKNEFEKESGIKIEN